MPYQTSCASTRTEPQPGRPYSLYMVTPPFAAGVAVRGQTTYVPGMMGTLPELFVKWFAARGWQARPHQLEALAAARAGEDVLLIAPTGGGKTLAGFLPSLVDLHQAPRPGLHT